METVYRILLIIRRIPYEFVDLMNLEFNQRFGWPIYITRHSTVVQPAALDMHDTAKTFQNIAKVSGLVRKQILII